MTDAPAVAIESVSKRFGATQALSDVSLALGAGRFYALLGPSGCGKTTLMRLIAGFETPDAGRIAIGGHDMARVPPEARPVNMMFQSYALFPHMSVADNIAFGLKRAGMKRDGIASRVTELLRLVQLGGLGARRPEQLSGGQRQRVALARALARQPQVLLLDEPMAALDRKLREQTQFELKDIQRLLGTTFLVVTHDQDEAMALADEIAIMRDGRIVQRGTASDIYANPNCHFVAGFLGETNFLPARRVVFADGFAQAETDDGMCVARVSGKAPRFDSVVAVRPECVAFVSGSASAENVFSGTVHEVVFRGSETVYRVRLPSGALLRMNRPRSDAIRPATGENVTVGFSRNDAALLDA